MLPPTHRSISEIKPHGRRGGGGGVARNATTIECIRRRATYGDRAPREDTEPINPTPEERRLSSDFFNRHRNAITRDLSET
jgi:hypothetical protein